MDFPLNSSLTVLGIDIVRKAVQMPAKTIAANAGFEGPVVVGKLIESDDAEIGFNAQTGVYVNMVKEGIIDPTKVSGTPVFFSRLTMIRCACLLY